MFKPTPKGLGELSHVKNSEEHLPDRKTCMSSGSVQEECVTFRELKLSLGILSEWKLVKMIMAKAFSFNLHNNL